ncbi:MAG: hypothetical protein U0167_17735 [bacterium]
MSSGRASWVGSLTAILLAAAVLRLAGLFSDLWLDEIWSLTATRAMRSVLDVFRVFRVDNNHHLNTIFLYLLGDRAWWPVYRLPSYAAGVATVACAWLVGRRDGLVGARLAAALVAASFLLINYASEARGYSPAVCLSMAGWLALLRFADAPTLARAAAFWACGILAVLAHVTALHFMVAAFAWLVAHEARQGGGAVRVARRVAAAFGVPAVALALFWLGALRGTQIGGGPDYRAVDVIVETVSSVAGGPAVGVGAWVVCLLSLGVLVPALVPSRATRDDSWVFYLVVVLISPATVAALVRGPVLFVRYFLVPAAFALLAVGRILAAALSTSSPRRVVAALVLGAYVAGNLWHVAALSRAGRGGYVAAVRMIGAETSGPYVSVSADHDFRVARVLAYYERFLRPGQRFVYFDRGHRPREGTDWYITQRTDGVVVAAPSVTDDLGHRYALRRIFASIRLSGSTWSVYRRTAAP